MQAEPGRWPNDRAGERHGRRIAAMALANHERLKLRIEVLEKRLAQAEWRGQPLRVSQPAFEKRTAGFARKHERF
jgi:hypothetical protein